MAKPKLAVVGLGKLGAPMAAIYADNGYEVVGADVDWRTVESFREGFDHINEPGYVELLNKNRPDAVQLEHGRKEGLDDVDVYFIVVPTPSQDDGTFTNEYVLDAIRTLATALRANENSWIIVVCSTVMPGSCEGEIKQAIMEFSGKIPGVDCGLVYSPEFIALGSVIRDMLHPDMQLIGASDETSADEIAAIHNSITPDVPIMFLNLKEAELTKIAINSYITMKISFANSIGMLADKMKGVDAFKVCNAIGNDSRIGVKYMSPGGPYGGPCFPRDTIAFETLFQDDVGAELVQATKWINDHQVQRAYDLIYAYLKLQPTAETFPTDVGILGMSYKPGTHIRIESFGENLKARLEEDGLTVLGDHDHDPDAVRNAHVVVMAQPIREFSHLEPYDEQIVIDFWDLLTSSHRNIIKVGKW